MASTQLHRIVTLLQREMQEYRNSLFWTPLAIALSLSVIMLCSVLLANRISVMGDGLLQGIMQEETSGDMKLSIRIDDASGAPATYEYHVERREGPVNEEEQGVSSRQNSSPQTPADLQEKIEQHLGTLNSMLNTLHNFLLMVLVLVSANYLLGTLYEDRRDNSILFFKSMPVSEGEEVLVKLGVALVVAPAIYIGASIITQFACTLLAMVLVWRMDMDPFQLILGNIEFGPLLLNQIGGWLLTALWVAPVYAWLLLASAAAKRSPFMFAIAPVLGLILVERLFLGTEFVSSAVKSHLPHQTDGGSAVGFYLYGPDWTGLDFVGLLLGLLFAAVAVAVAVYLRRYRFEI
jgi:hypothetical protein